MDLGGGFDLGYFQGKGRGLRLYDIMDDYDYAFSDIF